jgi:arabinose-5-phosphate isomerase
MGDALAMVLLKARNFSTEDFAALHPGGFLGRRLLKHVSEVHHTGNAIPLVERNATMKEMIIEMTSKRLGCVVMKDKNDKVIGIFTDGDFRRLAETNVDIFKSQAADVMVKNPKTISDSAVLDAALALMEEYSITQLPTVDAQGRLSGVLHLHDILKSKLV